MKSLHRRGAAYGEGINHPTDAIWRWKTQKPIIKTKKYIEDIKKTEQMAYKHSLNSACNRRALSHDATVQFKTIKLITSAH